MLLYLIIYYAWKHIKKFKENVTDRRLNKHYFSC